MNDIAKKVCVSRATVSYVLSGKENIAISDATKQIVLAAAEDLGYRPNRMARALIKGHTHLIALLVHGFHPAYYSYMVQTVRERVEATEYRLNVAQVLPDAVPKEATYWPVDGVLAFDCRSFVDSLPDEVLAETPIVSFGGSYSTKVDHIGVDLYAGTTSAIRHLIDIGRNRIAYILPTTDCRPGDARYDAFHASMIAANRKPLLLPFDQAPIVRRAACEAVIEAVRDGFSFDALFCFSDEIAIGAHLALRKLGLSIPRDVALIGCDGIADIEYVDPAITAIAQPYEILSDTAWGFLKRRLEDRTAPRQSRVLIPDLIVRGSTVAVS